MDYEKRVHSAMRDIHMGELAESAHDMSDGGLAVALAECATSEIGVEVDLDSDLDPSFLLFHEAPSRILISTGDPDLIREIASRHGVECDACWGYNRITLSNFKPSPQAR